MNEALLVNLPALLACIKPQTAPCPLRLPLACPRRGRFGRGGPGRFSLAFDASHLAASAIIGALAQLEEPVTFVIFAKSNFSIVICDYLKFEH